MIKLTHYVTFLLLLSVTLSLSANDIRYNHISLHASASNEVANDVLVAVLTVQENGADPADLATKVNKKMAAIIDDASNFEAIESHTTNYNSHALYKNSKIQSWQVSQQIKLTSQNFEQLGKLIEEVNELARVQSMTFKVSDERLEQTKTSLTKTAIEKFRNKAHFITKQFDKQNYQLVHISIDGNQNRPQPMRMERMMADTAMSAAPAVAAGTNKITVTINGTIELSAD